MTCAHLPATCDVHELFTAELARAGGAVLDVFDDGSRLFLRGVLNRGADVRPRDALDAGVALRTCGDEILIHPYTFRQVCTNGAILAHAIQTRRVAWPGFTAPAEAVAEVHDELREAVRACSDPAAFSQAVAEMRSATEAQADIVVHLLPFLSNLSQASRHANATLVADILRRFHADRDLSVFGLMNAVTATARDTRDPETRWRLEEFGGGMPARPAPRPCPAPGFAELAAVC